MPNFNLDIVMLTELEQMLIVKEDLNGTMKQQKRMAVIYKSILDYNIKMMKVYQMIQIKLIIGIKK